VQAVQTKTSSRARAAIARDAGQLRLRRLTQLSAAVMVALGTAFAALAAGSTHTKKAVIRVSARRPRAVLHVRAPAPPLVAAQSPAPPASAAPAAPVVTPTPTYSPPVVVSGGS
jgi:Fe-S cluster biogenesis protein NfuA